MKTSAPARGRNLQDFSHYDFGGGINIQDSPQKLGDSDLTSCTNMYLSTDGDLVQRLGINLVGSQLPAAATIGSRGLYRFYQEIAGGAVSTFAQTIKQIGSSLYDADTGALIGTAGQLGAGALDMSCTKIFDPASNGGTDILIICVGASGGPFAYDGTTLYNLNAGPTTIPGARWCVAIGAIVWFGGLPGQPNLVVSSYVNQPENTPGYNTFALTSPVTGLGVVGYGEQSALVVGLATGIAVISGFTPNSYAVNEIPMEDGVIGGRAMISVDGVLYFITNYAIFRYDGQAFTEISRKVRPWIVGDLNHQEYPMNGDRTKSWAMYYKRRIYFWYISSPATPFSGFITTALVWDLVREGWTIYQSQMPLGAGCAMNAPNDPAPAAFRVLDQNIASTYTFDVATAGNQNQSLDVSTPFASSWLSKFYKIGTPGTQTRLLRIEPELFASLINAGFTVVTDYGMTTVLTKLLKSPAGSSWDQVDWDQFNWDGTALTYFKYRIDVNIQGEAFAFGVDNPAPGIVTGLSGNEYRCMGFTGRFSQVPKN